MILHLMRFALISLYIATIPFQAVSYKVRDYEPADFPRVIALCKELQKESKEDGTCYELAVQLHEISFRKEQGPIFAKIVQADGNIIVFGLYEAPLVHKDIYDVVKALAEGQDEGPRREKAAKLSSFLVDPAYEGKGYSLLLFNDIKKELQDRGFSTLFAFVNNDDYARMDWYKKQGFTAINPGDSQTNLEKVLRIYNEQNAKTVMKFQLVELPPKKSSTISTQAENVIKDVIDVEKRRKNLERLKIIALKDGLKSFARFSVSGPLDIAQLLSILTYYFRSNVTRDDAYKFAARLLNKKVLSSQVKKYITKAMDFVEIDKPALMRAKGDSLVEYPQYAPMASSFLGSAGQEEMMSFSPDVEWYDEPFRE